MRLLALAPATVGELGPAEVVECAAAAGYAATGVRPPDPERDVPAVAAALRRAGVALLDLEYVRIVPGPLTGGQLARADAAAELGTRYLLVVSDDPDPGATAAALAALRDRLAGSATAVALEPMAFTAVRRLADAVDLARRVPGVRVPLDLPLSVEVHSDRLRARLDPVPRARLVRDAARTLLDPTQEA